MTDQPETSLSDAIDSTLTATMEKITSAEKSGGDAGDGSRDNDGAASGTKEGADLGTKDAGTDGDTGKKVADPTPAKPAPGSWPKEVKAKFSELPAEVQEYVHKRESEISRAINSYSQKAKFADAVTGALAPHEAVMRADGIDPVKAVGGLMQTYQILRNSPPAQKAQAVAQMIRQFGVDLSILGEDGKAGNSDPNIDRLYSRIGTLEQELARSRQTEDSAERNHIETTITDFAEKNPHFEAVRSHMGVLLQSGLAKDMQDAYDQATNAVPEIRATLLAEQETKRREDAAKRTEAARKAAAINVRTRGNHQATQPVGTMEDTMRETYRRIVGG